VLDELIQVMINARMKIKMKTAPINPAGARYKRMKRSGTPCVKSDFRNKKSEPVINPHSIGRKR
jgi:hypothetical protein